MDSSADAVGRELELHLDRVCDFLRRRELRSAAGRAVGGGLWTAAGLLAVRGLWALVVGPGAGFGAGAFLIVVLLAVLIAAALFWVNGWRALVGRPTRRDGAAWVDGATSGNDRVASALELAGEVPTSPFAAEALLDGVRHVHSILPRIARPSDVAIVPRRPLVAALAAWAVAAGVGVLGPANIGPTVAGWGGRAGGSDGSAFGSLLAAVAPGKTGVGEEANPPIRGTLGSSSGADAATGPRGMQSAVVAGAVASDANGALASPSTASAAAVGAGADRSPSAASGSATPQDNGTPPGTPPAASPAASPNPSQGNSATPPPSAGATPPGGSGGQPPPAAQNSASPPGRPPQAQAAKSHDEPHGDPSPSRGATGQGGKADGSGQGGGGDALKKSHGVAPLLLETRLPDVFEGRRRPGAEQRSPSAEQPPRAEDRPAGDQPTPDRAGDERPVSAYLVPPDQRHAVADYFKQFERDAEADRGLAADAASH